MSKKRNESYDVSVKLQRIEMDLEWTQNRTGPELEKRNYVHDVLLEHGGLCQVLPLAVHLEFLCWLGTEDPTKLDILFGFLCGTPPLCLKVVGGGLQDFSVSPGSERARESLRKSLSLTICLTPLTSNFA